ncbi:MAG: Crp/Fnr family transcriptional regulator [Candidatus Izemoplasmatales bacterium]
MNDLVNNKILEKFSLKCCYPKSTIVFHENDLCDRIGYVVEGKLQLIHYTINGEERVLAELNKNDLFGDFLINSNNPFYSGDLICTTDSIICFLDKKNLNILIENNKEFREKYISELSNKALKLNHHNKLLMQKSLRDKILMYIYNESIEKKVDRIKISGKQKLANYFNVTRQSLSRELKLMKEDNIIDYNKKIIRLVKR